MKGTVSLQCKIVVTYLNENTQSQIAYMTAAQPLHACLEAAYDTVDHARRLKGFVGRV